MKINISKLLKKNIEVLSFDVVFNESSLVRDDLNLNLVSPIRIYGNGYYEGGIVKLTGHIETDIKETCTRCLNPFDFHINIEFDELFSKDEDDEGLMYPIKDEEIYLKDMVIDNLILNIPLKLVCKEDCLGLCSICGKNLNVDQCHCNDDIIDPRFAVLKDLFKGGV